MVDERSNRLARPYGLEDPIVQRDEWLRRPRQKSFGKFGWRKQSNQSLESHWATPEQSAKLLQEISSIAKELGWSRKRLVLFKQAILRVRRQFPEVEIHVYEFAKLIGSWNLTKKEFREQRINPDLVDGCLLAEEPAIDTLCLGLMERMVKRERSQRINPAIFKNVVRLSAMPWSIIL